MRTTRTPKLIMPNHPTGQPVVPTTGPALHSTGEVVPRSVDLGREDHLVTWGEWFGRSHAAMSSVVPAELHDNLLFRATLTDGRQFLVREIRQHVSRGACTIEKTRWHERDAICDVITGYLLIGNDDHGVPTTVAVLPLEILSVECVLGMPIPPSADPEETQDAEEKRVFGFAKFAKALQDRPARVEEVEETGKAKNDEQDDAGEGVSA